MYEIVHQEGPTWAVLDDGKIILTGTKAQVEEYLDWLENQPRRETGEAGSTDRPDSAPMSDVRFLRVAMGRMAYLF